MANTVMNPGIPYVGPIPGGLQDGTMIVVSGTPEHHHNGFLISLQAGPAIDPRSDCAFVFNPRFNENCVVRNTLQMGSWGSEERHGGFPFHRGQRVEVIILVKPHHYKVSVNGRHFADYNHRMPKHRVTHVTVEQGLRCNYIRFEGQGGFHPHHGSGGIGAAIGAGIGSFLGGVVSGIERHEKHHYPSGSYPTGSVPPPAAPYPAPGAAPIYNPPVPFVQNIPGGLYPGKMIFISGIPHPGASRFSVYIQRGHQFEPHDIGMVVDARFNYGTDSMVVVRNHKQGSWGAEEKGCPFFPFAQNSNFDMIIMVENHCYKVAVNNQHLLEFHHRIQPISRVDTLRIDGDVRLTQVRFQ